MLEWIRKGSARRFFLYVLLVLGYVAGTVVSAMEDCPKRPLFGVEKMASCKNGYAVDEISVAF